MATPSSFTYQSPIMHKKIQFLWMCEIWGNFVKCSYFVDNCLIEVQIEKNPFAHVWRVSLRSSVAHHISLQLNFASFPKFAFFTVNSPRVIQRSVSQENAFKKEQKRLQVFKIAKFEFKVRVHYGQWAKCAQLWPLNMLKPLYTIFIISDLLPAN